MKSQFFYKSEKSAGKSSRDSVFVELDEEEDPHDVEMQRLMDKYDKLGFPAFYISTNVSLYKLD